MASKLPFEIPTIPRETDAALTLLRQTAERVLAKPDLHPEARARTEKELAFIGRMEAQRAAKRASPTSPPPAPIPA